ncbi:toll/interleukin-1 receptor domain-containing protein [Nocardia harenae]|uniref:toll/interleukin-1 receptor domain-containing protein n=1 Tax=Nocardia harenae TaxID=358707 RepID=UPI000830C5C4|nr:toll/interleukin-1 receptor domain-containing protein [Nocardia harenae]
MTKIFLSYRIADSAYAVREISRQMAERFGRDNIFRDDDSLGLGTLYARRIRKALEQADLLVAVIGPHWLDAADAAGNRRIDDRDDWVRLELATAYRRETPVIPVLLDDTELPAADRLPTDISDLGRSQFWRIRQRTMDSDIDDLIDRMVPDFGQAAAAPAPGGYPTQNITASDNSNVVTNNGGTQNVTFGARGRR